MTTALTGMQASETTIDVVGNNVSNSNTVGFKESSVLFATQFLQTQSIGSAPSTSNGGTNPRQVGLGVKVAEIAPDFTQGTIQVSSNPLDLAIQGDGFFMVQGQGGGSQQYYTRNGQFKTNANNELTTTDGNRVLGYKADSNFVIDTTKVVPLTIPLGGSAVAQQTKNVDLVGNLQPDDSGVATTPGMLESAIMSDDTIPHPGDIGVSDITAVDTPSASGATATLDTTASPPGSIPAGTYQYRIAYFNPNAPIGADEAPPTPAFGQTTVPAGGNGTIDLDLTGLPGPADSAFSMMRIYRVSSNDPSGQFEQVGGDLAASTTHFTDTAAAGGPNQLNLNDPGSTSYNYFYTFVDSAGLETRPSEESSSVTVSQDDQRIELKNIPQPTDATKYPTIRIYRSVSNQPGTFYQVDEVNAGTTTYVDSKPDASIIDPTKTLDRDGPKVTVATPLVDVTVRDGNNYTNPFQVGTLSFTGSKGASTGLDLPTKQLTITSTTTVDDLMKFMQDSLGIQTTSPDVNHPLTGNPGASLQNGQIVFESNDGINNAVNVKQTAFQLTDASGSPHAVNLPFSVTNPNDINGAGTSSEMIAYDSLGIPLTVRLTTSLESTTNGITTYRWYATSADNEDGAKTNVGTGLISFDGKGKYISSTNDTVSIDRTNVASNSPVVFSLDFSQVTALSQPSTSLQASSQDGFAAGTLSSFSITEDGSIKGVYSNGVTRDLGQIIMARFANAGGLQQVGNNLYAEGVNSGEPLLGTPGTSGIGSLTSGAVELSNSDIGQNLIDLILASTQYRGGTRVITSAQQLLDELLNLRAG
jgi:flagellar hook protein FlgE